MTDLARWEHAGTEPAVVLLHEGGGSLQSWLGTVSALAGPRRAIAYDRRGFGGSPREADFGPGHFDEALLDLLALLSARCTGPVDLVGHSDGGSIALLAAARHPHLVRSVIVVATHVMADPATVDAVRGFGPPQTWNSTLQERYASAHGGDWVEVVERWMTMWTTDAGIVGWDMRAELRDIRCPVLVAHDRADPLSATKHADAISDAVAGAQLSWYETGTHWPHIREHDRFAAEAQKFWLDLPVG